MTDEEHVRARLFALYDPDYRRFLCPLIPTVAQERVIGIRTPAIRALARELGGTPVGESFLDKLPHYYYEENNLHGFLIMRLRSFDDAVRAVDTFLPYVDNWATCDSLRPPVFTRHLPELAAHISIWLASSHTYAVRFGIEMLMNFFLDDSFDPSQMEAVSACIQEDYYIRMMVAWYFATALAKQYTAALPYLTENRLPVWTHNKTVQKATESYRITDEKKKYLRSLKRNGGNCSE